MNEDEEIQMDILIVIILERELKMILLKKQHKFTLIMAEGRKVILCHLTLKLKRK